jgi:hypothetical protein
VRQRHREARFLDRLDALGVLCWRMRARVVPGRAILSGAVRLLAMSVVLISAGRDARANDVLPFLVEYEAAPTCPTGTEFRVLLDRKLSATPGEQHSAISDALVRLSASTDGFVGRLELTRLDGTFSSRDISAASCGELAEAIAFVVALASRGGDAPTDFRALSLPPVPEPAVLRTAASRVSVRPPAPERSRSGAVWGVGGAALAGVRTGLGPTWTVTEGAALEVQAPAYGAWALVSRAGFSHAEPITRNDRYGSSVFAWNAGSLELCPTRFNRAKPLSVVPCWSTELGMLRVTGKPTLNQASRGRVASELWVAGSPLLRVEIEVVRHLSLQAQGQVILSFTPYRFVFDDPDTPVYRVPELAVAGHLGLSLNFP